MPASRIEIMGPMGYGKTTLAQAFADPVLSRAWAQKALGMLHP